MMVKFSFKNAYTDEIETRETELLDLLKDWEGEALHCPPNDTKLLSASLDGKDLLVETRVCGEPSLTPGRLFEDLMQLARALRDFPPQVIGKLAKMGVLFDIYCGRIEYLANYSYVRGVIDPEDRSIRLLDKNAEGDKAIIEGYHYPENHDPEKVLRDLAEAAGGLDQAMNDAEEALSDYDDERDK